MEDMQTDSNSQLEMMHETQQQQSEKRSQTVAAEEKAGYCYW